VVSAVESKVMYKKSGVYLFSAEHIQQSADNINPLRFESTVTRYSR
jgi:hypothetical protein